MAQSALVRPNPLHATEDTEVVRRLIRENPWGILVSTNNGEQVASHYPRSHHRMVALFVLGRHLSATARQALGAGGWLTLCQAVQARPNV